MLVSGLAGCDLTDLDPVSLELLVAVARSGQRALEALLVRAGERAIVMAATGAGPGPGELLVGRSEVRAATARTDAHRVATASRFPLLRDALLAGEIGGEHLDAVTWATRHLSDTELEALGVIEPEIVAATRGRTVELFVRWLRHCINRIRHRPEPTPHTQSNADPTPGDPEAAGAAGAAAEPNPVLRTWVDGQGRGHLSLETDLVTHEELCGLIERHRVQLAAASTKGHGKPARDPVPHPTQAARALIDHLTCSSGTSRRRSPRTAITILVDAATALNGPHPDTTCETARGTPLPLTTAARFACDALLRKVVLGPGGEPLDVGRAHRTATNAQWATLTALYTCCAWHGCDRPIDWCQAHHLIPWTPNGLTDLMNLVPLCNHHHHLVHEGGWRLELLADRTLLHHTPDDTLWRTTTPDRPAIAATGEQVAA